MLRVEDIHSYYADSYVLQGVSLGVDRGQVVAVLGRNGVGKSTLIRSIIGLTVPRRGRNFFNGIDITSLPAYRIARMGIGLVPQGRRIFPSLSVKEHLEVTSRSTGHVRWDISQIVSLFPNLGARLQQSGSKLSGGEQQMLAIGRALVGNPKLLLMDEPTEGLAPSLVRELGRVIDSIKTEGTAILLIEQHLAFALRHADRIYIMSKGRIVHNCAPAELATNSEVKSRYLGF